MSKFKNSIKLKNNDLKVQLILSQNKNFKDRNTIVEHSGLFELTRKVSGVREGN